MNSFIWKVSLYRFLDAFKLIALIFTLLFANNGLSPFEISLLIVFWSVSQLLFEIPMGIVADKYPRRNVLIVASLLVALGFSLWLIGGFFFYAVGMILYGLRNALVSGTHEAFVYDELESLDNADQYANINGRLDGSMQLGFMLSVILGGFIGQFSFSLAIILSIMSSLFAAITLLSIRSLNPVKSTGERKYFEVLKKAIKEIGSNSKILLAIIFISCTFGIAGAADKYVPLVFGSLGLSTTIIGALIALEVGMFALAGYTFSYWNRLKNNYWQYILILTSGTLFLFFGLGNSIVFLPLFFISSYVGKLALVKIDADLQHHISSDQRATVLSIKGLTFETVFILATVFFGFIASHFGLLLVITIWGLFYLLWTLLFIRRLMRL